MAKRKTAEEFDEDAFTDDGGAVEPVDADEPFKTDTSRERNNDDPFVSTVGDVAPDQPEDTSDTKAEAEASSNAAFSEAARAGDVEQNAPDQETGPEPGQAQPMIEGNKIEGVSEADFIWWQNSQNRNYMPGDGPQAGITEVDGTAQSASSVDPEVRARTLEESRESERESRDAQSVSTPVEG